MILKDLVKNMVAIVDGFLTLVEISMLKLNDRVLWIPKLVIDKETCSFTVSMMNLEGLEADKIRTFHFYYV